MPFRCHTCGAEHDGLPDLGFSTPHYFDAVPPAERARRCRWTSETCVIDDEDRFIRAVLPLPILGSDDYFGIGAWMSVSEKNLDAYERFGAGDLDEAPWITGYLSNELPGFPSCLELVVGTQPTDPAERPLLEMPPGDHPLARLFHWGIPPERLVAAFDEVLHVADATVDFGQAMRELAKLAARMPAWSFPIPGGAPVITQRQVLAGRAAVRFVAHDEEAWQFLDGEPVEEADAAVVTLRELVAADASLADLADLPLDASAMRVAPRAPWQVELAEASEPAGIVD